MEKYRIRHGDSIYVYNVQRKVLWWWKTIYIASSHKDAITYIEEELLFEVYTKDNFEELSKNNS